MKTFKFNLLALMSIFAMAANSAVIYPYPVYRQDSLSLAMENGSPVVTMYVTVPSAANYHVRFWMQGVKHVDGSFSAYTVKVNGQVQTGVLQTTKGDWEFLDLTGQNVISLGSGQNQIQVVGSSGDVPNIEFMSVSQGVSMYDPSDKYACEKAHLPHNPELVPYPMQSIVPVNYNKTYHYSTETTDSLYPPCCFAAQLDQRTYYTFYRKEYYSAGQTVTFQTDEIDGQHHTLYVFSASDPASHTWRALSYNATGQASLEVNITKSDFYYVLVAPMIDGYWGVCNLCIDNDRVFENVPVNGYRIRVEHADDYGQTSASFATSTNADPMIFVTSYGTGPVIDYNDDYPYDPSSSGFDWGKNARVNRQMTTLNRVLVALKNSYSGEISAYTDVYAGLKLETGGTLLHVFDNLYPDDMMVSAPETNDYNCISWALGEWTIGYWLKDFFREGELFCRIEPIDSLFAIYGFTRDGATASNADIDLYAIDRLNGDFSYTHAAVKSKRQPFAAGYAWESKMGPYARIFHPRYALNGGHYGSIKYHYWRKVEIPKVVFDTLRIIRNVALSQEEQSGISRSVSQIPAQVSKTFDELYAVCEEEGRLVVSIFLDDYERTPHYSELQAFCRRHAELLPLVFQRVNEGSPLAVKVLSDMTCDSHRRLWEFVVEELSREKRTRDGIPVVHNVFAEAKLFIKNYLRGGNEYKTVSGDTTYSTDQKFTLEMEGDHIAMNYILDSDAKVTVVLADVHGTNVRYALKNKPQSQGAQRVMLPRPAKGIYTVSLVVNGAVYEKKLAF